MGGTAPETAVSTTPMGSIREQNNFDILRLTAALLVLFSHTFSIFGLAEPSLHHQVTVYSKVHGISIPFSVFTLGSLGVTVFFTISGYLIAKSAYVRSDAAAFTKARCLRIYPAYCAQYLFVVLLLGPLVTHSGLGDYFAELLRHPGEYLCYLFIPAKIPDLPNVFHDNAIPYIVNTN